MLCWWLSLVCQATFRMTETAVVLKIKCKFFPITIKVNEVM